MSGNVQLGPKEATKVFVEQDTNRILGFAPELAKPLFPPEIRYKEYTLLHANEIERWVKKYRIQQEQDAYEATLRTIERESIFRKSLASAIRARNQHVSTMNQALNNTYLKLMDKRYDEIQHSKMHPQVFGMAEAYEADVSAAKVAMDSPYYHQPAERIAGGGAVKGDS